VSRFAIPRFVIPRFVISNGVRDLLLQAGSRSLTSFGMTGCGAFRVA